MKFVKRKGRQSDQSRFCMKKHERVVPDIGVVTKPQMNDFQNKPNLLQ